MRPGKGRQETRNRKQPRHVKIPSPCALAIVLALVAESNSPAQTVFALAQGNIIKITSNGTQSTFASGPGNPSQLAFNSAGNLFVTTADGNVFEYTAYGRQIPYASGLSSPQSMAFDNAGNLFVGELGGTIVEIATDGTQSNLPGIFSDPVGLIFDSHGDLFVANRHGNSVMEVETNGSTTTVGFIPSPTSLVLDDGGNVFAGTASGNIFEITTNGQQSMFASGLAGIAGLAFDSAGNLFEADENNGVINKFAPDGTHTTFASGQNYNGLAIQFAPQLQSIVTNGMFQVSVSMPSPYYSTVLQASTDLMHWQNISTNTSAFIVTGPVLPEVPYRFFRACSGP